MLQEHGASECVLAGGTDLVVALRNGTLRPRTLIDVKRIAELTPDISERDGWMTISATAVMATVEADTRVRRVFPALSEAAATVGSIQIRNRATLAGNICHASPAADTAPALLVYGAEVNIASVWGTRRVLLTDFFVGPGMTVLERGELVTSIALPIPQQRRGAVFLRVTRRRGVDLATINLCCKVEETGPTVFAYGAVGPRPFLIADESGVLADPSSPQPAKDAVWRQTLAHAHPITDVRGSREYRESMLEVMSRRALRAAMDRLAAG